MKKQCLFCDTVVPIKKKTLAKLDKNEVVCAVLCKSCTQLWREGKLPEKETDVE